MRKKILINFFLILLILNSQASAGESDQLYSKATKAAKSGQLDFAFMHYRSLFQKDPQGKYKEQALFALGEYFFLNAHYQEASKYFTTYLGNDFPKGRKLFALLYLFKIAQIKNNPPLIDELKKKIITFERQSFIFREAKEYQYLSPLNRSHKVIFTIDYIEFYIGGNWVEKISYKN